MDRKELEEMRENRLGEYNCFEVEVEQLVQLYKLKRSFVFGELLFVC